MITSSVKAQQVVEGFIQLQSINLFSGTGIQTELKIFMPRLNGKDFDYDSFASDLRSILDSFVLNKKTIKKYVEEENYMELSLQARNKFRDVYVNKGELGELILYTFLEGNLQAPKILSKMSLKTSSNMFVNGADGVHLLKISENNFNYDKNLIEKFEKLQPKFLKYTDKKNCDRVYTEIIKHLKNK